MLSRYLRTKKDGDERGGSGERRPYLATLCDDVDDAEKWRSQVLRDIRRRVADIQNPGLGEARIRELNDTINKLLRERRHWERRIVQLGGRSYGRPGGVAEFVKSGDGQDDVFENNGYFYFGAARELPGVQELMKTKRELREEALRRKNEESNASMYRRLDGYYFGDLAEEESAALTAAEAVAEKEFQAALVKEWEATHSGDGQEFGQSAEWDTTFESFIEKQPSAVTDDQVQMLILERQKAEALEQLDARTAMQE